MKKNSKKTQGKWLNKGEILYYIFLCDVKDNDCLVYFTGCYLYFTSFTTIVICSNSLFYRLDALDDNAYAAFQASRNLRDVVDRVMENKAGGVPGMKKKLSVKASLMTPVLPMLVSEAWPYHLKHTQLIDFSYMIKIWTRNLNILIHIQNLCY